MNHECEECEEKRKTYEECFVKWYEKEFVTGKTKVLGCQEEFKTYQECIKECLFKLHKDGEIYNFISEPKPTHITEDDIEGKTAAP